LPVTTDDQDGGELSALRDLVQSRGWQLLIEHIDKEWGPRGYGIKMKQAVVDIAKGPDRPYELAQVAERVTYTAGAVNEVVMWPTERMKVLSEKPKDRRPFANLRRA
jgi:hypothetical protein